MNGRFVIIEGLDFVGKTTLAKLVAEKLGGIYYKMPPRSLVDEWIEIDKDGIDFNQKRFDFFVKTAIYASREIEEIMASNPLTISDRWIWTTFAYHCANNRSLYNKYKDNYHDIIINLLKSELDILVHISNEQIWEERMREREASNCDQVILNNSSLRQNIFNLFLEFNPNFNLVENSGSIEQGTTAIMELLS